MFEVASMNWAVMAEPNVGEVLTALDLGEIWKTNPLVWAMEHGMVLDTAIKPLTTDTVGDFLMEAIAAQALSCVPGKYTSAMPLECLGKIVIVDFDPHKKVAQLDPAPNRKPRYMNGDPPIPMLFMTSISEEVQKNYHYAVARFVDNSKARVDVTNALDSVLVQMMEEAVTRIEAFYFLVKVQSLLTGAYKQRYLPGEIISPQMGEIVG